MFAYIPARIGSKRIPKKNIRLLGNKPVICHVIEQLSQVKELQGIAISTDSQDVIDIVAHYDKVVTLSLRKPEIADDKSTFMDLICNDLPRFQHYFQCDEVLFSLATSALITNNYFQQGIHQFKHNSHGLVMSVKALPRETALALTLNKQQELLPLFPENYQKSTQELTPLYADAGGFYIFNANQLRHKKMFIELAPISPVILTDNIAIDVDVESDWQQLEQQYNAINSA